MIVDHAPIGKKESGGRDSRCGPFGMQIPSYSVTIEDGTVVTSRYESIMTHSVAKIADISTSIFKGKKAVQALYRSCGTVHTKFNHFRGINNTAVRHRVAKKAENIFIVDNLFFIMAIKSETLVTLCFLFSLVFYSL